MPVGFVPQPEKKIGDEYISRDGTQYVVVSLKQPNPIPEDWMYSPVCMAWVKRVPQGEEH